MTCTSFNAVRLCSKSGASVLLHQFFGEIADCRAVPFVGVMHYTSMLAVCLAEAGSGPVSIEIVLRSITCYMWCPGTSHAGRQRCVLINDGRSFGMMAIRCILVDSSCSADVVLLVGLFAWCLTEQSR